MKKNTLFAIIALALCIASAKADVVINNTNFPSMGLSSWLCEHFNKHIGDTLTDEELATVKEINTKDMSYFGNTAGLEYFTELERLIVFSYRLNSGQGNPVVSIDLSKNKKLRYLYWTTYDPSTYSEVAILPKYLNVDGLTELDTIYIKYHQIESLDLSRCSKLKYLNVTSGNLASLKIDSCTDLRVLNCSKNNLKELDVTQLTNLSFLNCSNNQIASTLDLTDKSQLTSLNIANNKIPFLKVEGCHRIPSLDCSGNQLSELSVKNCVGLSSLKCNNNQLQTLVIDNLPKIEALNCSFNRLSNLSIANCEKLNTLNCGSNNLQSIAISNTPLLKTVTCSNNAFQNLDFLKDLTSVTEVDCSANPFTSLDISEAQSVTNINFSSCKKLSSFPILPSNISAIICSHSPIIAQADLSPYTKLTQLQADSCELTDFNAAMCPNLKKLDLTDNHILGLDLSALHKLSTKSGDVNIWQEIEMPAVWHADRKEWEITMPASFDHTRVKDMFGNYLGGSPRRGDTGTEVGVRSIKFIDANGRERFSFFVSTIYKGYDRYGNLVSPFIYHYKNRSILGYHGVGVTGYQVASGVNDVTTAKTVSAVRYYDLQGHESAEPFPGFNIEVTHFTDGTTQSQKIIK